jgi:hypothetical protein
MIKWLGSPILWGLLFIVGGVLFLLENLGIFHSSGLFWAIVLALGGFFFLTMFGGLRTNWWAIIPGITLLGVSLLIIIGELFPAFNDDLGGVIVLGAIGTGFLLIYLMNRSYWWAIVPAGVMFSISLMIAIDTYTTGFDAGGIILLGLGVTFAILARLPGLQVEMRWAWIPAVVLGLIGIFILAASSDIHGYLWPIALILLGLIFIWRTIRNQS